MLNLFFFYCIKNDDVFEVLLKIIYCLWVCFNDVFDLLVYFIIMYDDKIF